MNLCEFSLYFVNVYIINVYGNLVVPFVDPKSKPANFTQVNDDEPSLNLPSLLMSADRARDTNEFWRETEILSLVRATSENIDYDKCRRSYDKNTQPVRLVGTRNVSPICKSSVEFQLCPQCPHFSNETECELFRDFCRERRVHPSEHRTYCDRKYGPWRSVLIPADYSQCRCCDECVFYRELDQSCIHDEYAFDMEEYLPVNTIDFRAGCNPYWGHHEQESRALRCDDVLRRCVPVKVPSLPNEAVRMRTRRTFRYEPPPAGVDCPLSCAGYSCPSGTVPEDRCPRGAFIPDREHCNCCGRCSGYQQLNEKCAEFKKTLHKINGTEEIEVEEEFLEPGCDDGLVCRQGRCQDIHAVPPPAIGRRKREGAGNVPYEPCKQEMKFFKKKYGADGHLHYEAPQCTPLWLYAPIQCRRFVCYCALEDGTIIDGVKVPRVEVSNMNCDCARERCHTDFDLECDGYGNYKDALFSPLIDEWTDSGERGVETPKPMFQTQVKVTKQ